MAASKVIIDALLNIFPGDQVDLSGESLKLNQSDVFFTAMAPPVAVVFPTAVAQVQDLIKSAGEVGFSIAPKGAGLSYSDGYIPHNAHTVIVDMCKLNQIMEINERDRYVTVQPGVTWEQLHDALAKTGLRTPFWGTFSGKYATIGGAVSQGAKFFGSGNQGSVAESVLSLDVVIGDGSLVSTGSAATPHNPSPFYRYYGPDLTGLFLGDCGAYGIKTRLTMQLIPAPQSIKTASFSFQSAADMIGAMTEIGAQKLASECFALDPFLVNLRMKFEGLGEDLESLQKVFAAQRSLVSGITELANSVMPDTKDRCAAKTFWRLSRSSPKPSNFMRKLTKKGSKAKHSDANFCAPISVMAPIMSAADWNENEAVLMLCGAGINCIVKRVFMPYAPQSPRNKPVKSGP